MEPLHVGVFMVVQRFRGDLGLRAPARPRHGPDRMAVVLAHVHKVLAAVDEDDCYGSDYLRDLVPV